MALLLRLPILIVLLDAVPAQSSGALPDCDKQAIENVCNAWRADQRSLCLELEQVKCCLRAEGSRDLCCATAPAQIQALPLCRAALTEHAVVHCSTESLQAACHNCSREDCDACHEEEQVKCCLRHGGSKDLCCPAHSAGIRAQSFCQYQPTATGAAHCDANAVQAACEGCSGESCRTCRDEEEVKCCIANGSSRDLCCEDASAEVRASPACTTAPRAEAALVSCQPRAESPCRGRGEARELCFEEEAVECCMSKGGSRDGCCSSASPQVPVCKASLRASYQPCTPAAVEAACGSCFSCRFCREEHYVKCCLRSFGSWDRCCKNASVQTLGRPVCQASLAAGSRSQTRCSPEVVEAACSKCHGDGEACRACYEEQDVRCCIESGGSTDLCCEDAPPELKAQPICQIQSQIFP